MTKSKASIIGLIPLLLVGCMHVEVNKSIWVHPGYAVMAPKAMNKLDQGGYTAQSVFFNASDGTRLYGLLITKPKQKVTVLFFTGSGSQTGTDGLGVGKLFEALGVNGLFVDYRGEGGSEGAATASTFKSDALTAYDYLRSQHLTDKTAIVVMGFSVGSFIAPYVAEHRPISGLILVSTATDIRAWAKNQIPWYATPFVRIHIAKSMASSGLNNIKSLQKYRGPLMLIDGSADQITPPRFSTYLFKHSATPSGMKILYISKGKHHGEALEDPGAVKQCKKFINEIVLDHK